MSPFIRCFYCARPMTREYEVGFAPIGTSLTRDHILSRPARRLFNRDNHPGLFVTVPACYRCNQDRGSKLMGDFVLAHSYQSAPVHMKEGI